MKRAQAWAAAVAGRAGTPNANQQGPYFTYSRNSTLRETVTSAAMSANGTM
jgi:hypothetical protein